MDLEKLREELIRDEGRKSHPYTDQVGKITIGIGRNLTDNGLSDDEIDYLFKNDLAEAVAVVVDAIGGETWDELSDNRQRVLVNMAFNLGRAKFFRFKKMLTAIHQEDYEWAAKEILDSNAAKQHSEWGNLRYYFLANRMRIG